MDKKYQTPTIKENLSKNSEEKIEKIQFHFTEIMKTLGLDLSDDSLKDTPKRVAKMYVKEIFSGLLDNNETKMSTFENKYNYNQMLVEKDITLYSTCEHHFMPIIGKAHIAYISENRVIGLSKLNRIVEIYAKRPQVQERLTIQIVRHLQKILGTENVACVINAKHLCVNSRGIKHIDCSTVTSELGGVFQQKEYREELYRSIQMPL